MTSKKDITHEKIGNLYSIAYPLADQCLVPTVDTNHPHYEQTASKHFKDMLDKLDENDWGTLRDGIADWLVCELLSGRLLLNESENYEKA